MLIAELGAPAQQGHSSMLLVPFALIVTSAVRLSGGSSSWQPHQKLARLPGLQVWWACSCRH